MTRLLAILLIATACHGQTNAPLIGCDSASGLDSSELPWYKVVTHNLFEKEL